MTPCEYLFIGGRWKFLKRIGPICVCTKGAFNSTTGVECWIILPPPTLRRNDVSDDRG